MDDTTPVARKRRDEKADAAPVPDAAIEQRDLGTFTTVEVHAASAEHTGKRAWKFAAAKAMHRWPIGQEMHRADYDDAVTAAVTHTIR